MCELGCLFQQKIRLVGSDTFRAGFTTTPGKFCEMLRPHEAKYH